MHPSAWGCGSRDEGLPKPKDEVGIVESQFPEGKISKAKHHLSLGKSFQVTLPDLTI